jgi:hypothetical protein
LEHANELVRVPQAIATGADGVGHAMGHKPSVRVGLPLHNRLGAKLFNQHLLDALALLLKRLSNYYGDACLDKVVECRAPSSLG